MEINTLISILSVIGLIISLLILYENIGLKRVSGVKISNNDLVNLEENMIQKYMYLFDELYNEFLNLAEKNNINIKRDDFKSILSIFLDYGMLDDNDYFILLELSENRNKLVHNVPVNELEIKNNYLNLLYIKNKLSQTGFISKYDFENDVVNEKPNNMIVFEDEGNIIIKQGNGANDSLKYLSINSPHGSSDYIKIKTQPKKKIKITYYLRQTLYGNSGVGTGLHFCEGSKEGIWMAISHRMLKYYDKKMQPICDIDLNVWYKVAVELDCSRNIFLCYIDDDFIIQGNFRNKIDYVDTIRSSIWVRQDEWTTELDEIHF